MGALWTVRFWEQVVVMLIMVVWMREVKNAYRTLVGNSLEMLLLRRLRRRLENNVEMDLRGCELNLSSFIGEL